MKSVILRGAFVLMAIPVLTIGCSEPGDSGSIASVLSELGIGGRSNRDPNGAAELNGVGDPNSVADPNSMADPNSITDPNSVGGDPNDVNDDSRGSSSSGGDELRLRTRLRGNGRESGNADYRLEQNRERFKVEVEDFTPNTAHDIFLNGKMIGRINVGALGRGEVEFDTNLEPGHVPLPANFPAVVMSGDVVVVANIVSGTLALD